MAKVFISYRREDSAAEAGRLYDLLSQQFGRDAIFLDIDTVRAGTDYKAITQRYLQECDVLLAIIGRTWSDIRDRLGRRRLELADDLVRFEIEFALRRGITVIPVLVGGATAPLESALPDSLKALAQLHAIAVTTSEFRRDSKRLIETLTAFNQKQTHWKTRHALGLLILAILPLTWILLHFTHVRSAPIELDLQVSQFSFRLLHSQAVADGVSVMRFGITGLTEINLPEKRVTGQSGVLLETDPSSGNISLPQLVLPAGARVWYQRGAVPSEMQISVQGQTLEFQASVQGAVRIGLADAKSKAIVAHFDVPTRLGFRAESNVVEMTLLLPRRPAIRLLQDVMVDALSFQRLDESLAGENPVVRTVSAIEGGTMVFWPSSGPAHKVKAGDWVQIGSPKGQLRRVDFDNDSFSLRFTGTVSDVRAGSTEPGKSLMPSYLEVTRIQYPGSLLGLAMVIVLAAGLIALRRTATSA